MTDVLTADNIDSLLAQPLPDEPGLWCVTFRSRNPGMYHQLYANGELAGWTDTADQRAFFIEAVDAPTELAVAAVAPGRRTDDLSEYLPVSLRETGWIYRADIVRSVAYPPGSQIEVIGDHATGELAEEPLVTMTAWPESLPRFAWGQDIFGSGGFGYDGSLAPGLGRGAFGAGMFGLGSYIVAALIPLPEEGTHRLVFRVTTPDGSKAETQEELILSSPPPAPSAVFSAGSYEPQTATLTLHIE